MTFYGKKYDRVNNPPCSCVIQSRQWCVCAYVNTARIVLQMCQWQWCDIQYISQNLRGVSVCVITWYDSLTIIFVTAYNLAWMPKNKSYYWFFLKPCYPIYIRAGINKALCDADRLYNQACTALTSFCFICSFFFFFLDLWISPCQRFAYVDSVN